MMKLGTLSLAFALALSGCADSSAPDRDGDGGGNGSGSGSNEPQPTPQMDAQGTFRLNSTFDLATNMPGTSGVVLNGLIEATDDADDPMSWLVDLMLAQMADGWVKDGLVAVKPFVIGYLNDRVTALAPELFDTLVEIGQRMEDVTKKFGVNERYEIVAVDQTYIARSTADSVRLEIEGVAKDYLFTNHDIDNVIVNDIHIVLDRAQSKMKIGQHDLPLPWGKLVPLALDAAVIPSIDPTATGLADLLDNVVNCQAVGQAVQNALGFGGSALYAGACTAGLGMAADLIYDQLVDADSTLNMNLTGESRYTDTNNDYRIDELKFGNWDGKMSVAGDDANLAQPAAYVGKRELLTP